MSLSPELAHCDVLIVGGGLVGATLAACLARDARLRIVVVERMALPAPSTTDQHPSYDARNTALANGTCHVFDQLGLWTTLRALAEPILQVRVSDQGGFGATVIDAESETVRALGYVIENRLLGEVLLAHLQQSPQVAWLAPAQVASVKPRQAGVEVQVVDAQAQHQRWQARLLVVADGAQSTTCRQLGITAQRLDYGQTGIVTTVTPRNGHHNIAWERFTPEGPLALLPQTQQRLGVTWCVNSARAERLMALDDRAFMAELREAAGGELGDLIKVGQRHTYPLALTLSDEQIRSRVVVLGNAAHGLHPVAGQGFNMAVRDIATLVRVVAGSAQSASDCVVTRNRVLAGDSPGQFPGDPGELRHLQEYFAQRERDQHNTILFSDQITRWFSTTKPAPRLMRNTGLLMFELVPGAKRLLARHAMGRASSTWLPDPVLLTQAGEPEPGSGQRRRAAKAKDSAQPVTQRGARTRRKVKQS